MNDSTLVQETVPVETNVREKIRTRLAELREQNDSTRVRQQIENFTDFLNFLSQETDELAVLKKSYDPLEIDNGTGEIVLTLQAGNDPRVELDPEQVEYLRRELYEKDSETPPFYLEKTALSQLYLWYETGPETKEAFGTIENDRLRGFVKWHNRTDL